jgi:hypothetical protein
MRAVGHAQVSAPARGFGLAHISAFLTSLTVIENKEADKSIANFNPHAFPEFDVEAEACLRDPRIRVSSF